MSYTYANRLRTGMSVAMPAGSAWAQSYGYDSARRLTSTTSPAGTFNYHYDPVQLQRVDTLDLPNGAIITNAYDSVARLTLTELENSAGTNLDSYAYTYNQANQRTNVLRTAGDHVAYTYDNEGELIGAFGREASGATRTFDRFNYTYDAGGNLLTRGRPAGNNAVTFKVNNLNEITNTVLGSGNPLTGWSAATLVSGSTTTPATNVSVNGQNAALYADNSFYYAVSVTNGVNPFTANATNSLGLWSTNLSVVTVKTNNSAYAYDLNGNLLTDGTRNFAYDDENELISIWATNVWRNDFVYDGKMRRRIEKDYTWSGSAWSQTNEIHFIYDGNLVVQERNTNNQPVVEYTRGTDLSGSLQGAGGIGGLLARSQDSLPPTPFYTAHSYYHADGNGNITALINASQTIVAKYLYDSFGNNLAQSGSLADANIYHFSSKEWNSSSGLYYYLYRFYNPNLQRWPNRDPLGDFGSITYDQMQKRGGYRLFLKVLRQPNGYEFIDNKPTTAVDLFGLQSWIGPGYGSMGPDGPGGSGNYSNKPGCPCGNGGTYQSFASQSFGGDISACAEAMASKVPPQSWPLPVQIITGSPWSGPVAIGTWGGAAGTYIEARLMCESLTCVGGNPPSSPPFPLPIMPPSLCSTCVVNGPGAF